MALTWRSGGSILTGLPNEEIAALLAYSLTILRWHVARPHPQLFCAKYCQVCQVCNRPSVRPPTFRKAIVTSARACTAADCRARARGRRDEAGLGADSAEAVGVDVNRRILKRLPGAKMESALRAVEPRYNPLDPGLPRNDILCST